MAQLLTESALTRATPVRPAPTEALTPLPPTLALPTAGATITPPELPAPSGTPAVPETMCAGACVQPAEHFWLERPIHADHVDDVERTYAYGSTQGGQREPHHGVEFVNPADTPVIAAAPGTVIVAGNDSIIAYGPAPKFYGNLVVVKLDQAYDGQPVFNLYGHLKSVAAKVGQPVNTGDMLGAIGQTGIAIGPHLHFEVRVGQNDYASTRNPELWLKPLRYNSQSWGVIAGRVTDTEGNLVKDLTVAIRPIAIDYEIIRNRFITTYVLGDDAQPLNGDDRLQENFAIGDMPLGTYSVSVNTTRTYQQTITVEAGRITWVTFVVTPPLPTETPAP